MDQAQKTTAIEKMVNECFDDFDKALEAGRTFAAKRHVTIAYMLLLKLDDIASVAESAK